MKLPLRRSGVFLVLALLVGLVLGYILGTRPRTYADCLLAHVKQGMNVEATELAARACQAKYAATAGAVPDPSPRRRARRPRRAR